MSGSICLGSILFDAELFVAEVSALKCPSSGWRSCFTIPTGEIRTVCQIRINFAFIIMSIKTSQNTRCFNYLKENVIVAFRGHISDWRTIFYAKLVKYAKLLSCLIGEQLFLFWL